MEKKKSGKKKKEQPNLTKKTTFIQLCHPQESPVSKEI